MPLPHDPGLTVLVDEERHRHDAAWRAKLEGHRPHVVVETTAIAGLRGLGAIGWRAMSSSRLLSLLTNDLRAAWEGLRRARPTDAFYAFGLYSTEEVEYLTVTASSQEGLSEVARQYVARTGEDFALLVHQLRWSPCDSPLHAPDDADFGASSQEVDRLRADGAGSEEILDVAVDALRALDGEGVFGPSATRELVLGIWFGDQSDESRLDFVRRLNPPTVAERFRRESQLPCVSSDGRSRRAWALPQRAASAARVTSTWAT